MDISPLLRLIRSMYLTHYMIDVDTAYRAILPAKNLDETQHLALFRRDWKNALSTLLKLLGKTFPIKQRKWNRMLSGRRGMLLNIFSETITSFRR